MDGRRTITIITQQPESPVLPWLRLLLGDRAGDVVEDQERSTVVPWSMVLCERLDLLGRETLARVRRTGTVGLLHVGDHQYRARLDAYTSFALVWRTYYHSALTGLPVRQLPLGPGAVGEVTPEPLPAASKPPSERRYTWSISGHPMGRPQAMLEAFRSIEGGYEDVSEGADDAVDRRAGGSMGILADSMFAPCGVGQAHIESHRIYDALEAGAIPVIVRRRRFDYFTLLFGHHPLPTLRSWDQAPSLVMNLLSDRPALAALQQQVVAWWTATKHALAGAVRDDVDTRLINPKAVTRPLDAIIAAGPLNGLPPRWRGRFEAWRHRNPLTSRS